MSSIVVVGGGPAGMMAASTAAKLGGKVILLEPNSVLGKKLRITGKGRCNVTNDCTPQEMLQHVTRNQKFLYSSLFRFKPEDTMAYFEALGVPLKTERGRRVFPVSDHAGDIAGAMVKDLRESGVEIRKERALEILLEKEETGAIVSGVRTNQGLMEASSVIIATGGLSYPGTGSTGDGYQMAEKLGVKVTDIQPSLIPICTKEDVSELQGLSLKNVVLRLFAPNGKIEYEELGEMLFTHFGISGPLSLSASSHMQKYPVSNYRMEIDWKPALSDDELDARIQKDFSENITRDFCNSLGALLPKSAIPYMVRISGVPEHKKVNQITKEERRKFVFCLKHMPITPKEFRPIDEAIVTCGGISVEELDPKTMMVKWLPGLFFAGEIIDLDAYTGGYNLQIAFCTGKAAGEAAANYVNEK